MTNEEFLAMLRCPMDPSHTHLIHDGDRLICERCRVKFRINGPFPVMIIEEAELPPGCPDIGHLPCQKAK
jgi:uncharacterized protein